MSRASFDIVISGLISQRINFAYIVRLAACSRPWLLSKHIATNQRWSWLKLMREVMQRQEVWTGYDFDAASTITQWANPSESGPCHWHHASRLIYRHGLAIGARRGGGAGRGGERHPRPHNDPSANNSPISRQMMLARYAAFLINVPHMLYHPSSPIISSSHCLSLFIVSHARSDVFGWIPHGILDATMVSLFHGMRFSKSKLTVSPLPSQSHKSGFTLIML